MPRIGRGAPIPKLRYLRERLAMSQHDLASAAGVSDATVSRLEVDPERHADFPTIKKLAGALGVQPRELMD